MERYYSLNRYLRETFGEKVYKLALDAGMTCPNRDGTLGTGGCIFCSAGGSGDFAQGQCESVREQIQKAKLRIQGKTGRRNRKRIHLPGSTLECRRIYLPALLSSLHRRKRAGDI